jgi:hypothetical protein
LRVGDKFIGPSGELAVLVDSQRADYPDGITVYNFAVEDDHNYFVIANYEAFQNGAQPVLVHNANGSYTITFDNGKKYHGKGDYDRALVSAKRLEDARGIKRTDIDWTPADSTRQSFIDEAIRIKNDGGVGDGKRNYNKINSPGEKLRIQKGD